MFLFWFLSVSLKTNYGIELELTEFKPIMDYNGFKADFILNRDVNYYIFGLYKIGDKEYNDKMILLLNTEFTYSSSQKKGSNFSITKKITLNRLMTGIFYFQLDDQDGGSFRSNQFHFNNRDSSWMIKRPQGVIEIPEKPESYAIKYKDYIIGGCIVLGIIFAVLIVKLI